MRMLIIPFALLAAASQALPAQAPPAVAQTAAWPIKAPTPERVKAVRACDPAVTPPMPIATDSTAACLLARRVAAEVRAIPRGGSLADSTRTKLASLVAQEPLFLLTLPLFYSASFGQSRIVNVPPVAEQTVVALDIHYKWTGYGNPLSWTATVTPAAGDSAVVVIKQDSVPDKTRNIATALITAIGPAMTDFFPVAAAPEAQPCFDNTPDWTVNVTFRDNRKIQLTTNKSNMFSIGGPYQLELDGQKYLQLSNALVVAIGRLSQAAGFQFGQPRAFSCNARQSVFDLSYPKDR